MVVVTRIEVARDEPGMAVFHGELAALIDQKALDLSVLGCDILNLFALIADRQGDLLCLVGQRHPYTINKR